MQLKKKNDENESRAFYTGRTAAYTTAQTLTIPCSIELNLIHQYMNVTCVS